MAIILTRSHDRGVNLAPACCPGKDPLTTPPSGFCRIAPTQAQALKHGPGLCCEVLPRAHAFKMTPTEQPIAPHEPIPHRKVIREWLVPLSEQATAKALILLVWLPSRRIPKRRAGTT